MKSSIEIETLPPLSLYIHIPWCVRKCPYCDFNSHVASTTLPEADYVDALIADLTQDSHYAAGRKLHSIFFGGGTPSLFSASAIGKLIEAAEQQLGFVEDIEITLEANPGTAEQGKFKGFYDAGVNRLSVGVQSFNARHLALLGRIHNSDEAKNAIDMAHQAGFNRVNIDLMHGLPQQNVENALEDLQQALKLGVRHLSWYQLTIEQNTEFYRTPPTLPEEDSLADIQENGISLLKNAGFQQYEVSAYAQEGHQARHNCNYWEFGDYLGIGAGAHGKVTLLPENKIQRLWKTRQPNHYLDRSKNYMAGQRSLCPESLPLEFMMNALRLTQGVPATMFSQRTGLALSCIEPALAELRNSDMLIDSPEWLKTTALGQRFINTILESFMTNKQ